MTGVAWRAKTVAALLNLTENPWIILLIIKLTLLMVGVFMDMNPAVLIFTLIFLPIALSLGIDPVHFGIIMIANLSIGLLTPPVGTCLFVGAGVGQSDIVRVSRAMLPFYLVMFLALLLITFFEPRTGLAEVQLDRPGRAAAAALEVRGQVLLRDSR